MGIACIVKLCIVKIMSVLMPMMMNAIIIYPTFALIVDGAAVYQVAK